MGSVAGSKAVPLRCDELASCESLKMVEALRSKFTKREEDRKLLPSEASDAEASGGHDN